MTLRLKPITTTRNAVDIEATLQNQPIPAVLACRTVYVAFHYSSELRLNVAAFWADTGWNGVVDLYHTMPSSSS